MFELTPSANGGDAFACRAFLRAKVSDGTHPDNLKIQWRKVGNGSWNNCKNHTYQSDEICDTLKNLRRQVPPMQVGQYGQLQEWFEDWYHPNDRHRHISHLWGLYPGYQISPYRSPVLFEAAKNTLIQRGDPSTGW